MCIKVTEVQDWNLDYVMRGMSGLGKSMPPIICFMVVLMRRQGGVKLKDSGRYYVLADANVSIDVSQCSSPLFNPT